MSKGTIRINKKGEDGYKVISIRIKEGVLNKIDDLSKRSNRSRNELVNILLENSVDDDDNGLLEEENPNKYEKNKNDEEEEPKRRDDKLRGEPQKKGGYQIKRNEEPEEKRYNKPQRNEPEADDGDEELPPGVASINKTEKIVMENGRKKKITKIIKVMEDGSKQVETTKEVIEE